MPDAAHRTPYRLGLAVTDAEREAVYAFRYAHYYSHLVDAPGVDHRAKRVYSPHDDFSDHHAGYAQDGTLVIVGTGTRASTENLPPEWEALLRLQRLSPLGLQNILIYSRLVEHSAIHGSPLFAEFFRYTARYFTERGYAYSIHYCAPALVPIYERMGYRTYGGGYTLSSGLYRIPMILLPSNTARLGSILAPFTHALHGITTSDDVARAITIFPELATTPLCAMRADACVNHVRGIFAKSSGNVSLAASIPDAAGKILRKATLFPLAKGDSPIHSNDAPLLWLPLESSCETTNAKGEKTVVTPGTFINGHACKTLTAMEAGRVLFFSPKNISLEAEAAILHHSLWSRLI